MPKVNDITSPFTLPGMAGAYKSHPIKKQSALDAAKDSEKNPAAVANAPAQQARVESHHPERPQVSIQSTQTADAVRHKLQQQGVDLESPQANETRQRLATDLSTALEQHPEGLTPDQVEELVKKGIRQVPTEGLMPGRQPGAEVDRDQMIRDLQQSLLQSTDELDQLKKQIATSPDHLENAKQAHDMVRGVDALHAACKTAIRAVEQSSRSIKMHLHEIEQRTKVVRDLLDLNDLMVKYEDREKLDLAKPQNLQETNDFTRMRELRITAQKNGIQWDIESGWNSKKDQQRYSRGVSALVGALQAQNKVKDLEMQQAVQVFSSYTLLTTNMILAAGQLNKDIIRNINR